MIKTMGAGAATLLLQGLSTDLAARESTKKHIVTLSFDDGFKKSSILTAEIFEKHKLSACINVIASGHLGNYKSIDAYQTTDRGDFGLWNELKERGHEVMPHGYKHANKTELPLENAKELIMRCLDYFSAHLKGFDPKKCVFNFPYNASSPELESWLAEKVMAFRTGGFEGINPMPHKKQKRLTCTSFGPGSAEDHLEQQIKSLLALPSGWLIYNTHGLDGEGWGPVRAEFLDRLLERLKATPSVDILPAGQALAAVQ